MPSIFGIKGGRVAWNEVFLESNLGDLASVTDPGIQGDMTAFFESPKSRTCASDQTVFDIYFPL